MTRKINMKLKFLNITKLVMIFAKQSKIDCSLFHYNIKTFFFQIYFIKRKFVYTVNKTTASQNVTRRRKSITSVHPSPEVGHEIGRGLLNDSISPAVINKKITCLIRMSIF